MLRKLRLPIAFLLLSAIANAQLPETRQPTDDPAKRKKQAVEFLRETLSDVGNLRTLENRISFTSEMAGLMWYVDENEARAMFSSAMGDFRQLLMQYDAGMNALGPKNPDDESDAGGFLMLMSDPTERSKLAKKFRLALAVRQQIASSVAEHDPDLALAFYEGVRQSVSNPEFVTQFETRDQHFEGQLLAKIAETNPSKASQVGLKTLAKGLTNEHVELLKKIYEKDAEKGAEFAAALLGRSKSDKVNVEGIYALGSLLTFGASSMEESAKKGGKPAVYSRQQLRELSDVLAQAILSGAGRDENGISGMQYIDEIEKFSPSRAVQIRAKLKTPPAAAYGTNSTTGSAPPAARGMAVNSNSVSEPEMERIARAEQERELAEKEMEEGVQKLGSKELPKEEREKIIGRARQIIAQTPGKDKKIAALSMLAAQVAAADKELAAEIMRDAHALVNPQPKNFRDFILVWMLATGYAKADPDKAFPLLEDTFYRANQTLEAFVKVGEFIDVAEEMIQDGEVQVGAFGGSVVRGLTGELGMADSVIGELVEADFDKTRALTNRFERPEVRIMAKMMVLQAVLGKKAPIPAAAPAETAAEEMLNTEQ